MRNSGVLDAVDLASLWAMWGTLVLVG
jgi:hypothetical protein